MALPDSLKKGLDMVFVGTAVTKSSKEAGAYYATHGNSFYKMLHSVGITEKEVLPDQYRDLLKEGIGLTDLVKSRTGLDNELSNEDFDIPAFKQKMANFCPRIICFNGKLAAAYYLLGNKKTKNINYGLQEETLNGSRLFVLPSTAKTAQKYWNEQPWKELAALAASLS